MSDITYTLRFTEVEGVTQPSSLSTDAVTVIKPESLRELIKSEAEKIVKIY